MTKLLWRESPNESVRKYRKRKINEVIEVRRNSYLKSIRNKDLLEDVINKINHV